MTTIDVNSDVGESFGRWTLGDDAAMMAAVTSANVACGFHAGDPTTLRRTCQDAAAAGVVIGAQVGYRDLAGFGRRFIDMDPVELADDIVYQIGALQALAAVAGSRVSYVKPHGALYNTAVHHEVQARAVVDAVRSVDPALPVLGLPGSRLLALAEAAGLRAVTEAFADRGLHPGGHSGAAVAARCAAARPGRGGRQDGPAGDRREDHRRGRIRHRGPRRKPVRARRFARRRADGRRRPGRAAAGRDHRAGVRT